MTFKRVFDGGRWVLELECTLGARERHGVECLCTIYMSTNHGYIFNPKALLCDLKLNFQLLDCKVFFFFDIFFVF